MTHTPTGDIITDPDILEFIGAKFDEFLDSIFSTDEAEDKVIEWTVSYFPDLYEQVQTIPLGGEYDKAQWALEQGQAMVEWAMARILADKFRTYTAETEVPHCCRCGVAMGWSGKGWIHPSVGPRCPVKEVW